MKEKFDVMKMVTDRLIQQMQAGQIPWHKPWNSVIGECPINLFSGKPYQGLNPLLLSKSGCYGSFKQWTDAGCKIKKGAKSEIVTFRKPATYKARGVDSDGKEVVEIRPYWLDMYYRVIHIDDVELSDKAKRRVEKLEQETETVEIPEASQVITDYIAREGLKIKICKSNRAFYSPSKDYIQIPEITQYKEASEYYATAYHEMGHSTGHTSRLGRFDPEKFTAFGSRDYSKEELVAEMTSAILCNAVGIETATQWSNSVAYLQGWIKALKADPKIAPTAATAAKNAALYILYGEKYEPETETETITF